MNIIITMAGRGSRFRDVGIDKPKHRIAIKGRTMFWYAMSSLIDFFDEQFIFVCLSEYDDTPFLREQCSQLGIEAFEIVEIPAITDGQATTALQADAYMDDDDAALIYNIDTYIEEDTIQKEQIRGDGWLPVFRVAGDRWSFIRVENDEVVQVAEKERISELATVGLYYFDTWGEYKTAYQQRGKKIETQYGEKYIAPLYNWLIENDKSVRHNEIPKQNVHVLGTPEDVVQFDPEFDNRINE